jgi:8-oxo-dGTP pyrophosphatase MutT (NUDIX family)
MPIISNGVIAFRKHPITKAIEYLMICRKDTLGLMDFTRGKYSVNNKYYIMNMIAQMTNAEKQMILTESFDTIWRHVWHKHLGEPSPLKEPLASGEPLALKEPSPLKEALASGEPSPLKEALASAEALSNTFTKYGLPPGLDISASGLARWRPTNKDVLEGSSAHEGGDSHLHRFKSEEHISRDKFNQLRKGIYINSRYHNGNSLNFTLESLINECPNSWNEPEWGFPKGRRNYNENDIECALREFYEETGFKNRNMGFVVSNLAPYEEVFMGSNYKSYKHRYFLMYMDYNMSLDEKMTDSDNTEISKIEWKSFNDCLTSIRPYNLEKKRVLSNVNIVLKTCTNTLA